VLNPTGQRLQNVQVSLVNALAAPGVANISARADNEGRFRLSNVPPGQYVLTARAAPGRAEAVRLEGPAGRGVAPAAPPDQQRLWAMLDVTVDGRNISNIAIALQPGLTVSGRIVFAGTTKPAPTDLSRLRVTASTADTTGPARQLAQNASGRVEANGRFTITGVVPGRYRIAASNPGSGWFLESSIVDGQDTLDFPVEVKGNQNVTSAVITFTDRQAELSGTLTNEHSQPAPGYTIVLYPYDQRYWTPQSRRIRTARPSTDGRFTFSNVPPGDYRLAPIVDTEPGAWYDPAFLQQLDAGALRVQILEGEKKVQNVRISTGG
jgi:hypothetical protein